MEKKIKVIYVSGIGRSGTTLIDMLLSADKKVVSSGEIYKYNYMINGDKTCACDEKISSCKFWQNIVDKNITIINRYKVKYYLKMLAIIFLPFFKLKFQGSENSKFFSKMKKHIDSDAYILDSSKDPARLVDLIQDENIEVYNITIIRDPRLVANSFASTKQRTNGKNIIITTFKWIFIYSILKIIPYRFKNKSLTINYENLCSDYKSSFQKINKFLGLELGDNYIEEIRNMDYHQLGGNRIRSRKNRIKFNGIRYDSSRKKNLGKFNQYIVLTISFPFFYFWIYRKSNTKSK